MRIKIDLVGTYSTEFICPRIPHGQEMRNVETINLAARQVAREAMAPDRRCFWSAIVAMVVLRGAFVVRYSSIKVRKLEPSVMTRIASIRHLGRHQVEPKLNSAVAIERSQVF